MKIEPQNISIREFDYELPHERIAEFPLAERDASKLLAYQNGTISDGFFYQLPQYLPEQATLVLNNTRVIEARILFKKPTGGVIEIFCLEPFGESIEQSLLRKGHAQWSCLIGGASKWKPGQLLQKEMEVNGDRIMLTARYVSRQLDSFVIEFNWPTDLVFADVIHAAGQIPLPPYIKRTVVDEDRERYQTIFGKYEGSVAAPTAALHFTSRVFEALSEKQIRTAYVTLHVGAGTFKPVKSETIAGHQMHQEPFTVSSALLETLLRSEKIIAVGTTSLRTLESLYWLGVKLLKQNKEDWQLEQWEAYQLADQFPSVSKTESLQALLHWMKAHGQGQIHCHTSLIIVPGYAFQLPDALITNFHQPQSTLLLLVSAFIGEDWKKIYRHALDHGYRFLSYGDSSLLWRNSQ